MLVSLRGALAAAGTIGRAIHRVHPDKPSPADVAALFPGASPLPASTIAREMSGLRYQNQLLVFMAQRRGKQILEPYLDAPSLERLKPFASGPASIFLTWHVGPPFGLLGAFGRLGLDVLAIRRNQVIGPSVWPDAVVRGQSPQATRSDPSLTSTERGPAARARAVFRAVARLRKGGLIIIAGDGVDTAETLAAPCLGRAAPMARGPFALARITGAPLVPLLARWDDDGWIRVTVGDALPGRGSGRALESSLAIAAGKWLEDYLLASPRQLRRCSLGWLLTSPPLEQPGYQESPADSTRASTPAVP